MHLEKQQSIQKAWFLSDIRTQILRIAFELSDDPSYSKDQAIEDLIKIIEPIDVEAQINLKE
jgi:virulence-associated protein VapD